MAPWSLPADVAFWITHLSAVLHQRLAWRLPLLMAGALFAQGRRTVASWLRGGQLGQDYKAYYYFLGSLGRNVNYVAGLLLRLAIRLLTPGERLLFACDDTPTQRYGPLVEGAGIHRDPTPGPAAHKFLYGHVWVTLSWLVRHACWGTIGLPLLALLYVRQKNLRSIAPWYQVTFQTKLQQAAALVAWLVESLQGLGKTVWLVADGAFAKRPFLAPAKAAGVVVVSRLRKDAALWSVPKVLRPEERGPGRPCTYGKEKFSLAKRVGHRCGWQSDDFVLYGQTVRKTYKTFLATYKPAGGLIRVVLVKDSGQWTPFFCTQAEASVHDILEAVADRSAIEQNFHDLKEVHGAGQQQLRNYWANIAAYHLCLWWHTLIELWAWAKRQRVLTDRSASPWDDATRRPSHADRRNALRRQCLQEEFQHAQSAGGPARKFRKLWKRLLQFMA